MIKISNNDEYSRLLLRFSKDNDIYNELNGIFTLTKKGTHTLINSSLIRSIWALSKIFDDYITWDETSEGFDFWYIIHLKWAVYLKKHASQKYDLKKFENHCRKTSLLPLYNMYKTEFNELCSQQQ